MDALKGKATDWYKQKHSEVLAEHRKVQVDYQRKLIEHQWRYRCHLCGKSSSSPLIRKREIDSGNYIWWDRPTDLKKPIRWGKWTCRNDIRINTCKACCGDL